tara:strand:- start:1081 stop:1338 length:258 start_codon:yes stop_codon:yes gene_type:complete
VDEFILDVMIDNQQTKMKTYQDSIEQVVDAVVTMEVVTNIFKATRVKDNRYWTFPDIDLTELRELRRTIKNKGAIAIELSNFKTH